MLFINGILLPALALGQSRWEVTFGVSNEDNYLFRKKAIDYDKGILFNWMGTGYTNRYLSKMDLNGVELWTKSVYNGNIIQLHLVLSDTNKTILGGSTSGFPFMSSLTKCYDLNWCNNFINQGLFDHGHFMDAVLLDSNRVLAMAYLEPPDIGINKTDRIYLFEYDSTGELLWYKLYASGINYPQMEYPIPYYLTKFDDYYIISGWCYYPPPDNPQLMVMRPMFIRIDQNFNEQWMLPYGADSNVVGMATGVIEDGLTGDNIAVGKLIDMGTDLTPLIHFDSLGSEKGIFVIDNDSIGTSVQANVSFDIVNLSDSKYLLLTSFGPNSQGNPLGELLLDSNYRVINSLSHPNTTIEITRIDSLGNNQFLFGVNIYENPPNNYNRDILLYKLNADLTQAKIDTNTYVYDSLCPHAIVSDTIYLNDCDIVTALPEFPTPAAWQQSKQTVELTAYPNPVNGNTVNFKLKYTKYHDNMQLVVYDISGRLLVTLPITSGAKTATLSTTGFSPGMHVAVVRDNKKVLGKVVFSVVE
jgi:hypothetical protein